VAYPSPQAKRPRIGTAYKEPHFERRSEGLYESFNRIPGDHAAHLQRALLAGAVPFDTEITRVSRRWLYRIVILMLAAIIVSSLIVLY
jgi:hypothetical protein